MGHSNQPFVLLDISPRRVSKEASLNERPSAGGAGASLVPPIYTIGLCHEQRNLATCALFANNGSLAAAEGVVYYVETPSRTSI